MKRQSLFLSALTLAASLVAAAPASATVIWQSDFVNKGLDQFSIYDVGPQINPEFTQSSGPSRWSVSNGGLHQDSNIYGNPDPADAETNPYTGTTAVVKGVNEQDGIFFVQFSTADDDGVGLVFRWQDEKNFMRFTSMAGSGNGGPFSRLEKWTNGEFEVLALTQEPDEHYQRNVPETMLVVANGNQIEAYVGDLNQPLLTATDSDPKPGSFGLHLYAQDQLNVTSFGALTPDSNVFIANILDAQNRAIAGRWASLQKDGQAVAGAFTNPTGQALLLDVAPGDYQLKVGGLTVSDVAAQTATVRSGISSGTFEFDLKSTPLVADLSTGEGAQWRAKIPATPEEDFRAPDASETGFEPYVAPSLDWDTIDESNNIFGWLRVNVPVPAEYVGKDLVLADWNFDDEDWTYWNGQLIGHETVWNQRRAYVIPGNLVQAQNVLAIRGFDGSGGGGITEAAPKLYVANPSVTITGRVTDPSGNPVSGVEVSAFSPVTAWGPQNASSTTGPDGNYILSGLAAGDYTITRTERLDLDPAGAQSVQQTGAAGQSVTANFTVTPRPSGMLNGSWGLLYGAEPGDLTPSKTTGVNENDFEEVTVPGTLEAQGFGDDQSLFWYRRKITLPDSWKAFQGRDLILTGFNVDDADVTYFNGVEIGKTGTLPTDPFDPNGTGYSGDAGGIRTYTIPASLVNWDGENVIAINGYENGGDSGITNSAPTLIVGPAAVAPVTYGDLTGDGRVNVQDATLSLRIAVGSLTPTPAQVQAGDVNGDGRLNVQDTTLILRRAVGSITSFPVEQG